MFKETKLMLCAIATFMVCHLLIGTISYLLSDISFKQALSSNSTFMITAILGIIPTVIVTINYSEYLGE
jgi:hypothetical protein